jgi:carboxyl-terminal processing protease
VTTLLERSHYRRAAIDDDISSQVLDHYLDSLDGNRLYFYRSDIDDFETLRSNIDDAVKRGRLEPVFDVYRRYVNRARERMDYALALLEEQPDFTLDESFRFDRSEQPWAANREEMDELWRQRVKNDALGLMLTGKTWEESRDILFKWYG